MAKARITVVLKEDQTGKPNEVCIYLNPEGRDLLINELAHLSATSDHFHMMPADWADSEVPLAMYPYAPEKEMLVPHVKMMFRTDEWDKQYFPHVIPESDARDT